MKSQLRDPNGGLLVVRRINYFEHTLQTIEQHQPALPLSHDKILAQYKGFEGQPWPDEHGVEDLDLDRGLAPPRCYDVVVDYYRRVSHIWACELLYLAFIDSPNVALPKPRNFSFCGYDYGYYVSEFNLYSSLFNEIIYGKYEPLRAFVQILNENLLIPSLDAFEKIDRTRQELLAAGADLETDEPCGPISIHHLT
jgi:hypothetical protein